MKIRKSNRRAGRRSFSHSFAGGWTPFPRPRRLLLEVLEDRMLLAVLTWDPDGQNNGVFGGSGDWYTPDAWVDAATNTRYTWDSTHGGDEAVFTGSAGTVNLGSNVTVRSIAFQSPGYVIQNSILTVESGSIDVAMGAVDTVNSGIAGNAGLTKMGGGTLVVGGGNVYAGATSITGGTLRLAPPTTPVSGGSTNLALWLDATNSSTLTKDANGNVSEWRSSGVGLTDKLTQTTARRQPNLIPGAINGRDAIGFSASTQDQLTTATNFAAPVTVLYVGRMTGGANGRLVASVNNNWLLGYHGGAQDRAYFEGWVNVPSTSAETATHLYSATIAGSGQNSSLYSNGNLLASNQGGVTGPNGLSLGGWAWGMEFSNGQIGELLVYRSVPMPARFSV